MRPSRTPAISTFVVAILVAVGVLSGAAPAHAATPTGASLPADATSDATTMVPQSMAGFDPGNIIEDAVFFAKDTMDAGAIQTFLNSKVATCQPGYTCLKNYSMATVTRPADLMCRSTYTGRASESAAQIIYNVAQACGINPQVLLVTLQKEQGLITHTAPSAQRYRAAMGQGCPDTAACDSRYYGFFNQVYGAAWQLKRYANPPGTNQTFTWYAPGRTWNILYHPNRACGTTPVYVQNQATANLYYYTPYQPNAAARAADYSTGDGCSSYGNRNFYNYFTDWFGSTKATNVTLVRTEREPTVYLISGTKRYSILDAEDYGQLHGVYGPTYIVSDAFVAGKADAGRGSAVLRNESTGVMSLVQSGRLHPFATCDLVARWGASCASPVNVSAALLSRVAATSGVTGFFRVRGSTLWGRLDSTTTVTPLWDAAAARAVGGLTATPKALYLNTATYQARVKKALAFAPAQLVRTTTNAQVYLTDQYSRLLRVDAWADVAELGRVPSSVVTVAADQLTQGYTDRGTIEPLVRCAGVVYMPAAGRLVRIDDPGRTGWAVSDLGEVTCAQFPISATRVSGPLFVKVATSPNLYLVEGGTRRIMPDMTTVVRTNGGTVPAIVTVLDSTMASIPAQQPIPDGSIAKGATADTLYATSGGTLHPIPSLGLANDLGMRLSGYVTYPAHIVALMPKGAELRNWVTCGGATYFGSSGVLRAVSGSATDGFAPVALSESLCSGLAVSAEPAVAAVFVRSAGGPTIYLAQNGVYRPVSSWGTLLRLGGGVSPTTLVVTPQTLAGMPKGAPVT